MGVNGGKTSVKKSARKATKSTAGSVSAPSEAGSNPRAIVGIGASAGGLEAFTELLRHLPIDTGLGFVLVQHLDPSHLSILPAILSKATRMLVTSVEDGMPVRPNEVYVIPPNRTMTIAQGVLRLQPRDEKYSYRPIDEFFRSLGEDQKSCGIGIILSGTASDGTIGVELIKAEGGITFAQDASAKYDSMPQSAIAAGHVDFVLAPDKIAEEIARIGRHPYVLSAATRSVDTTSPADSKSTQNGYQEILRLLRRATGVDFTHYRANTVTRRITRRTILHHIHGLTNYATYLRNHPAETEALMQDLLISVTSFFRNPEAFDALKKKVISKLLQQHETDEPLRIWVYGCSTGEEAYSIAMNFLEFAGERGSQIPIQIYATDLNGAAIDRARPGLYSKSLVHHVSPQRLRRFFVETEAGYRMNRTIRDMCIFARQNLMTDPPFSRMDLISCRNVLIYMEPVLQRRIIPMFHYALKPTGFLLLGLSETVGTDTDLFVPIDKKYKIYAKKLTSSRARFGLTADKLTSQGPLSAITGERPTEAPVFDPQKEGDRILLAKYTPASVLVDSRMEILQVRGSTGAYLEAPTGKATHNVLKMAREDLMLPLRRALQQAKAEDRRIQTPGVRSKHNGQLREIRMEVVPIRGSPAHEPYFLILFYSAIVAADSAVAQPVRKTAKPPRSNRPAKRPDEGRQLADLQQQFDASREYSQSVLEQQEAFTEELQSANEEVQSTNEELQSINEELETAKEELQSSNEELTTINEELENRNRETHELNADLTNLLTCVRMPILMTDRDLRIRLFTPSAAKTLNLIDTDVGRPITHLKLEFEIPNLSELQTNIDKINEREHEVRDRQGRWYKLYIGPYKTAENRTDGVVLVLTDIQALKETEQTISAARYYAEAIVRTVRHPLLILNGNLRVKTASASFYEVFQVSPTDTENQLIYEIGNRQWNIPELRKLLEKVLPRDGQFYDFEVQHDFPSIGPRTMLLNARRLQQHQNQEPLILLAMEDITERRFADAERSRMKEERVAHAEAEELSRAKDEFLATMSHELRTPLNSILGWSNLLNTHPMLDADKTRALESIERNARVQAKLIEDLLDASRIVAGKLRLDSQEVDPLAIVLAAIDIVRQAADAKRIQMVVFNGERAVGPVWGDPQRLQQVLWNLLSNAVKFTPPEGRIDVRLDWTTSRVQISVTDSGQGVKAEFMPYLFQRFRQADSSTTRKHGGLGLGLAIVRHLVELHGGTVWAESQGEGQGSTFIVQLPLRAVQPAVSAPELSSRHVLDQSQPGVASLQNARVLVVDDEDDTRNLLTAVFEHYGAEVKTAASVAEALAVLPTWKPAVLVCDIAMPDQDGYTLIREVRQLSPEHGGQIPALALTAYGKEEDRRRALEAGYQAHLTKPANPAELVSLVIRLATKTRQRTRRQQQRNVKVN